MSNEIPYTPPDQTDSVTSTSRVEFTPQFEDAVRFKKDTETPAAYRERLNTLYPEPVQQAFLNAAWEGAIPGAVGMYAANQYGVSH